MSKTEASDVTEKKPGLLERLFGRIRAPYALAAPKKLKTTSNAMDTEEIDEADREVTLELLKSIEASVRDLDSRLGRIEKKNQKSMIDSGKRTDKRLAAITNLAHRMRKTEVRIARCEIALKKMQEKMR